MWRHFLLSLNISVPRQFYNPSDFFFKLGLPWGRNLKQNDRNLQIVTEQVNL